MKTFNKILSLLGKKAPIDLDNDGKIESLGQEVTGLFERFVHTHNKLQKVNEELVKIKAEEEAIAKKAQERIVKIEQEVVVNSKLAEKVAEFIKK